MSSMDLMIFAVLSDDVLISRIASAIFFMEESPSLAADFASVAKIFA